MNLQLFAKAYDKYSIVDYLSSTGQDSSYSARETLAKNLGIENYKGSGEQNTQMLNMLKSGTGSGVVKAGTDVAKSVADNAGKNTPSATAYTPPSDVVNAGVKKDEAWNTLTSMSAPTVNADYLQTLNTQFTEPTAYTEAMSYLNAQSAKIVSGRTSYTDQIRDMMNKIQNREKFSYDVENDTLFQQALASAMGSGKQAMQDTIGQASALTGGYGSTYATSAGNQSYNAYIQDAYDNLPQYYQMALEAYNMEGQEMYNQLSMLNDADATEYGRMIDAYNIKSAEAQDIYNRAYSAYQDNWNNTYNMANLDLEQQSMAYNKALNEYNATVDNYNTLYQNSYDNYWNEADNTYRYDALSQDQSQFVSRYDLNGDGKVDNKDIQMEMSYKSSSSGSGSGSGSDSDSELKEPTETQMKKALEAYNTGGEEELYKYVDSLPSNIDVDAIDMYVNGDGGDKKGYGVLPLEKRTYTKTDDTFNWFWGDDNNDVVTDQYGNTFRIDELPKELRGELTKLKKGESNK